MATTPTIEDLTPRDRIGNVTAGFLIATALTVDAIHFGLYLFGLIPIIGWAIAAVAPFLVTAMAWIIFYLWYKLLGIDFLDGAARKAFTFFGSAVLELVPLLNALPLWTLGTVLMVMIVRTEDKIHNARISKRRQGLEQELTHASDKILEQRYAYQRQQAEGTGYAPETA